ncbi:MAG: peptidase MA family metallohydrolase [Phycisphaerae bacterium]
MKLTRNDLRTPIVVATVFLLFIPATGQSLDPLDMDGMQAAIRAFRSGRYELAEQLALELADRDEHAVPRAWLVVAEARRKRGRDAASAEAYRRFLTSCESPRLRSYVRQRLMENRSSASYNHGRDLISEDMSPREMSQLARVNQQVRTAEGEHFVVRTHNARLASLLVGRAEESLRRICGVLLGGQAWPHVVDVYVWTDRDEFQRHAEDAPDYSGGNFSLRYGADGIVRRIDLTQLDERGRFDVVMVDRVLPHELSHLVLHEYFGESHCPLFLDEGLAMLAETETDENRIVLAGTAIAAGRHIPLPRLFLATREDLDDPALFYAQSLSFVEYLRSRMTPAQFGRFLQNVKSGSTIVEALQRALYIPPDEGFLRDLAAAWQDYAVAQAQYIRALRGEAGLLENGTN